MSALIAALLGCADPEAPPLEEAGPTVWVHRSGHTLYLLDAEGEVVKQEPIGIGREGLEVKRDMADLVTPTGTFTVDLVISEAGTHNAVAPEVLPRFADDPEFVGLLSGDPGLGGLYANMSGLDFDGDGTPDKAYGSAYIGLDSDHAETGPKLHR